jgi:hypothetical protein
MSTIVTILSMLHEGPSEKTGSDLIMTLDKMGSDPISTASNAEKGYVRFSSNPVSGEKKGTYPFSASMNSATRLFRGKPVLGWTLDRLRQCRTRTDLVVLCWDDQLEAAVEAAHVAGAEVLTRGARHAVPSLDAVTASRKWADGWRGGAFGTCSFDAGFFAPYVLEIVHDWAAKSAILIDPASALVDPDFIDGLATHAERKESAEVVFTQAAPGLAGVLLRTPLVERLAKARLHVGRLLHYVPVEPIPDPIAGQGCFNVPTRVARTRQNFLLNSDRQIERIGRATEDLNGQLIDTEAEELVRRLESWPQPDPMPREVVLELTTRRATRPIFSPLSAHAVDRPDLTLDQARTLFDQLGRSDDIRLTLAGVGDPLLHPQAIDIIRLARQAGIAAIHVETDLLDLSPQQIDALVAAGVDILSIHLPALSHATYEAIMGVPRFVEAINNITAVIAARQQRSAGVPLIVPVFTKCTQNFAEMEPWYDNWLKMLGSAVIAGPSDYAQQIVQIGVADMTPATRRPCQRLAQRLTILSDGRVTTCETDFHGRQALGHLTDDTIHDLWTRRLAPLREAHRIQDFTNFSLCQNCTEWHRP